MAWQPDYATSAELKHYARIPDGDGEDTVDDAELGLALTAASRAVDRATFRQFGKVDASTTRVYTARWSPGLASYVVDVDDLYDDDVVTVTSDDTAVTDFTLEPINAIADGKPYTRMVFDSSVSTERNAISITSTRYGWASVPSTVQLATLIQAARFFKRRDSPFGIAGSPDLGNELRLLARLDPDVELTLHGYRRWDGAVA